MEGFMLVSPRPFVLAALLTSMAAPIFAGQATVPRGAILAVRIDRALSSEEAAAGDTFTATIIDPIYVDGKTAIAAGSVVDGVVTVVRSRALGYRSGVLGLRFSRLHAPDGGNYPIDGTLVGFRRPEPRDLAARHVRGMRAVVVIGTESDGPSKRPSSLVGDAGEDEGTLADRWSHSGLGPELAEIDAGAELTLELRRPVEVERPLIE
jgi:hypothetical protein